ncbi:protoporphyrinogen oxidase [Paenibacillus sp. OAS669]|uniref:protoporphyrinogen oxidase n=1 Tax=Paenibacillus sp. OAS669 TaxID=2663821 RepID=UPI00178BF662|nr:protoporphyrinogen oxidase [Paenibacillus sp. OAS669]MBE1445176.1 oxygen-dependent protoporphyrinogen oxidase [Paenibacillus sp. OAS669]
MKTAVVIGGGITGLSAAYYLNKKMKANNLDLRVVVLEANEKLGGKINTHYESEFIMETGADSIVTRKDNVAPFIEELNLQEEVVYNATGISFLYIDGELKKIPEDTVFGIPLSIESLAKSNLISAEGKVEALKDFYTKNETFTKNDSVGLFLESFLGKEIVERQISPVLSGVYSGRLQDLTIASTLPYLLDYKNEYGSIIRGLSENKQKFKGTGNRKFLSFKNGVSTLVDALENRLSDVEVLKGTKAQKIEKDQGRYRILCEQHEAIEADFVVLSTLHTASQKLLNSEELDQDFNQLKNNSLISVYLGFDIPDEQLPQDGTGFIVAEESKLVCDACTWTSRKWEHTSKNRHLLVRLFYKSLKPVYSKLQQLSEEELLEVALKDIKNSLGITSKPVTHEVTKWHETMPNYHIKHNEIVKSLEKRMEAHYPNVILAGCSYYGVGIPDCIANGQAAAERIAAQLS